MLVHNGCSVNVILNEKNKNNNEIILSIKNVINIISYNPHHNPKRHVLLLLHLIKEKYQ